MKEGHSDLSMETCALVLPPDAPTDLRIRTQVEFYFSDSNLLHDRYMRRKIEEASRDSNGWIDLSLLTTFRRIQEIGATIEDIAEAFSSYCPQDAAENFGSNQQSSKSAPEDGTEIAAETQCASDLSAVVSTYRHAPPPDGAQVSAVVELSADKTRIRRRLPLPLTEEAETSHFKTLFIGNLPFGIDHVALAKVCSEFGTVCNVSLPRFKVSRDFKGFGFVAFDSGEAAVSAQEALDGKWPLAWETDEGRRHHPSSSCRTTNPLRRRNNKRNIHALLYSDWLSWKEDENRRKKCFSQHQHAASFSQPCGEPREQQHRKSQAQLNDTCDVHTSSSALDEIQIVTDREPRGSGCIAHITGLRPPVSSLAILHFVKHSVVPQHVDYCPMSTEAWVRFNSPEDMTYFIDDCAKAPQISIGSSRQVIRPLRNLDEERAYWRRVQNKRRRKDNSTETGVAVAPTDDA